MNTMTMEPPTRMGRPPVVDEFVLSKLEEAFALGCTDREACLYAGIGTATLYRFEERNPDFRERKEMLKENPVLLARKAVIQGFAADPKLALRYLQARLPAEFNPMSGAFDGATFQQNNYYTFTDPQGQKVIEAHKEFMHEITKAPEPIEGEVIDGKV